MLEERSAGAVVFRLMVSGPTYLLLKYTAGHWDFPKGNRERGEQPTDTTVREIREETGISQVRLVPGFQRGITYYYRRDGQLVHKEVEFYLAQTEQEEVQLSSEHLSFIWLPFPRAEKRLTYNNARVVLRAAHAHLRSTGLVQATTPLDPFTRAEPTGPRHQP